MDAYRTSNLGYIRQSSASRVDEGVPNNADLRIGYEQTQVKVILVLKVLLIVLLVLSLPLIYNLFRFGGLTNSCGQKRSVGSVVWSPFRWLLGGKSDDSCSIKVSTDVKTDDRYLIETKTETTTCSQDRTRGERAVGKGIDAAHGLNPSHVTLAAAHGDDYPDANAAADAKGGSIWDYFRLPSFGCSEYKDHLSQLENLKPSVGFFRKLMPSVDEVLQNGPKYAKMVSEVAKLNPLGGDSDVSEVRGLFAQILDPSRQWKTADESALGALIRKPKEWLMNIKNVFSIQNLIGDWKKSGDNLGKKKGYVAALKDKMDAMPFDAKKCSDRLGDLDAQLGLQGGKLGDLMAEKGSLENQIQENQLKMNAWVSQRNTKEQEPINTVRQLDLELQELKFKLASIPALKADLEARLKAIRKAEDDLAELRRRLDSDAASTDDLQAKIDAANAEISALKHSMESLKVKLAMRRMKLQLANSNRQIKDYLMSLIRTNNGEPVDFQELFSTSENARKEIRRILKEFINQSAGMKVEINVTEAQIDEIIAKDQSEFEEIRRIYTELVAIINQYGDFNIYISALARDIQDLESKMAADDRQINDLLRKAREWKALLDGAGPRRAAWSAEISRLEKFIADARRYIDDKEAEMRRWQDDYDKLRARKDLFVAEHQVG